MTARLGGDSKFGLYRCVTCGLVYALENPLPRKFPLCSSNKVRPAHGGQIVNTVTPCFGHLRMVLVEECM